MCNAIVRKAVIKLLNAYEILFIQLQPEQSMHIC